MKQLYLLLVENNFISSREIKSLLHQNKISCEIVNCSSADALLDIAEKIAPEIVVIDFDFFMDASADIVKEVRRHSAGAYILAFVDPDHYGRLHQAIDDGIDNYMVKPLQREDVLLRIKMGLQHQGRGSSVLVVDDVDVSDVGDVGDVDVGSVVTNAAFQVALTAEPTPEIVSYDQALFGFSAETENTGSITVPEMDRSAEPQEPSLIDEAFSLVDNLEDLEEIKSAGGPVNADAGVSIEADTKQDLPYIDDLFTREPFTDRDPETVQMPEKTAPAVFHWEPENEFNKEPELPEAEGSSLDDKELFGVTSAERFGDRSSFEDLFDAFDGSAKKKKRAPVEPKVKTSKEGKIEYLPFVRKSTAASTSIPAAAIPGNFKDQRAVHENSKKYKADPQKTVKARQKSPLKKQESSSKFFRVAGNFVTALLLIMMVSLSFFLIQSRISGGSPAIAGHQMYVVLSGSMNPAFDTGSIVFVRPTEPSEIVEGDIITFSSTGDATRKTTHRVVGLNWDNGLSFITRGDANNVNDPNPVPAENVVGRVTGSVPYIGYLFGFAQTRLGLILLIFIPGLFLIIMELRRLFKHMVEAKVEQLSGSATAESASAGTSPDPQAAGGRSVQPGSGRDHRLKDFGF